MNLKFYLHTNCLAQTFKKFLAFTLVVLCVNFSNAQGPATALNFDGVNDYVNVAANPLLNISSSITLEAWINPTRGIGVQDVLSKSSSSANNGYIFPRTSQGWNSVEFLININGVGWKQLKVPYGLDKIGQWHHLAATYDGYTMRIFIDGILAGKRNQSGTITVNNNPLTIGVQPGYSEYFQGDVDELRIWNRALPQCEVVNNMNCEVGGSPTGLAAYYKFNQGVLNLPNPGINLLTDASGNNLNGTLTNFGLTGLLSNWSAGTVTGNCTVFIPPVVSAGSLQSLVAVGGTINLTASGGIAYSWTGPNGFTSTVQNPAVTGVSTLESGTYTVAITTLTGCIVELSTIVTVAPKASGLSFNGIDNDITIPFSPLFNTNTISIETWIFPQGGTTLIQNVTSNSSRYSDDGFKFPKTNDGWQTFSFALNIDNVWKVLSAPFPASALNQWNQLAATFDGYFMRIYLNGALAGTLEVTGTRTTNTNNITIGNQDGRAEFFKGIVDELRIWNRALSQCEIINNMQTCELNGDNNGIALQTGLTAYYRFNQGLINLNNSTETILADSSGHGNNGRLNNFRLTGSESNWLAGKVNGTCAFFPLPTLSASANGSSFETGSTVNLFSANGNGSQYTWDGPNAFSTTVQNPTINNVQPAASGTYTVTTPYVNCVVTASTRINVSSESRIIANGPTTFCPSGSVTLSTSNSGTDYKWYLNEVLISGATVNQYTATLAGNYRVTFMKGLNLFVSAPITLTVVDNLAPVPDVAQLSSLQLITPNATVTLFPTATDNCRGSITATTLNPVSFVTEGTFTITWIYNDQNGNISKQDQQVVVLDGIPPVLTLPANITVNGDAGICGATANFTATATDNSGGPVTISYSPVSGSIFPIGTTTVTVTAADARNNITTGSFTVTVLPTIVSPITGNTNVCIGSTTVLSTISTLTGGVWSSSNNTVATVDASGVVSGLNSGTVVITYTNNCGATASATVTVNAIPSAPVVLVSDNCGSSLLSTNSGGILLWSTGENSSSITVTGAGAYTITQTVNGCISAPGSGTASPKALPSTPVVSITNNCGISTLSTNATGTLLWSTGATTSTITVSNAGTYAVTQTANGCTSIAGSGNALPKVIPAAPAVIVTDNCDGTSILTASGAPGATFAWSPGVGTGSTISVSIAGTYTAIQTVNGCTSVSSSVVTASPKTSPSAPTVSVVNNCDGTSSLTASGAPGATFAWSPGGGAGSTISVSIAGTYTATQTVNGCTSIASFVVTASPKTPLPMPTVSVVNNCDGTSSLTVSGAPGATFAWSPGGGTGSTITVSIAGTYTATQTVNGCTSAASLGVTASPKTTPSAPTVSVVDNCNGTSTLTASGAAGATFAWSPGGGAGSTIPVSIAGAYTATQTVNGCTSIASFVVTASPKTSPSAPTVSVVNNCDGTSSLTASGVPGATFAWSPGVGTGSTISVSIAGTYIVTQTVNGCTSAAGSGNALPKVIPSAPVVTVTDNCGTSTLSTNAGGTLLWSTGATTSIITVGNAGTYTVTQTVNGCTSAAGLGTSLPKALPSTPLITVVNNCGSTTLSTNAGGTLLWNTGATTSSINVTIAGNYSVSVTNAGGCSATSAITAVTVNAFPVVTPITGNTLVTVGSSIQLANATPGGVWSSSSLVTVTATGLVSGISGGIATINYTVTNNSGCATTVSTTITVNACVTPTATITASNVDAYCNKLTLTGGSNASNVTYRWVYGSTTFANTQQISLGQTNGDGVYQLLVSINSCPSVSVSYNYQKQNLVSSYTILAYKEAELGKYNAVASGSVGIMTSKGEAAFKAYSSVNGAGSFVKAPKIDRDGSGINILNPIIGIATVVLPAMQYNTAITNSLPNYSVSQNTTVTLNANYNKLTIKKGANVTVNGTTFGTIKMEEGASIKFTNSTLNIDNLTVDKGVKNVNYSYVRFAPNTSVRVRSKVSIGSQVLVNPDNNKVTFYMSDLKNDEEKFTVMGGDTKVIANIYMPDGKIKVTGSNADDDNDDRNNNCDHNAHNARDCKHKGHDHNDCDHRAHNAANCSDNVYMTGLFIAEEVESKGNTVIWNSFDCSAPAITVMPIMSDITITEYIADKKVVETSEKELKITVMPNPSTTYFTLKFESRYETPLNIRVMDASGRVVDAKSSVGSNSTMQIGHNYSSGTYFAEIIQGAKHQVIQLIKVRG